MIGLSLCYCVCAGEIGVVQNVLRCGLLALDGVMVDADELAQRLALWICELVSNGEVALSGLAELWFSVRCGLLQFVTCVTKGCKVS